MRWFFVMLLLVACHQEKKQELQLDQTEKLAENSDSSREWEAKSEKAPVDTDTKTTKFENAVVTQAPDGEIQVAKVMPGKPLRLAPGSKIIGTVPLAQVLTEQDKHVGPVTETKSGAAKAKTSREDDKNSKLGAKSEETTDTGFGWKFYLTLFGAALAVISAILIILKYKLWRPL